MEKKERKNLFFPIILDVLIVLGIGINLDGPGAGGGIRGVLHDFFMSFDNCSILYPLIFLVLFPFIQKGMGLEGRNYRLKMDYFCTIFPAALFSFGMVWGFSYQEKGTWNLVMGSGLNVTRAILAFGGYFFLLYFAIVYVYSGLDYVSCKENTKTEGTKVYKYKIVEKYMYYLHKRPFVVIICTMLICYLPYMILSYPGIFMGDTNAYITQWYGQAMYPQMVSDSVSVSNHHPVVYTALFSLFVTIGKELLGSANLGVFFNSIIQTLSLCAVISSILAFGVRKNISNKSILVCLAYFCISPRIQHYLFLNTKDIMFTACLCLYMYLVYLKLGDFTECTKKYYFVAVLSALGIFFFRNEGVYILLFSAFLVLVFYKKKRKMTLVFLGAVLAVNFLWNSVLLPVCEVTPSSKREVLSLPFQQTARYLRDFPEEVTEEEKEAISQILEYDSLAELYNPNLSDSVKATYKFESTDEDFRKYIKVWAQMFLKHPDVYIEATFNNKYQYLYPSPTIYYTYDVSNNWMVELDHIMEKNGHKKMEVHYPASLERLRYVYEWVREELLNIPIWSMLSMTITYTWSLILLVFYLIRKKKIGMICAVSPLIVIFGVSLLGPANGEYFRYLFPYAVCMPLFILLAAYDSKLCRTVLEGNVRTKKR